MNSRKKQFEHACETHDHYLPDRDVGEIPFDELKALIMRAGRLMKGISLDRYAAMVISVGKGRTLEDDGFQGVEI